MALRDLISPKPYPISTPGAQPTAPAPVVVEDDVAPLEKSLSAGRTTLEQLRSDQTRMGGEAANLTLQIASDTANLVSYRNAQEVFNAQQKVAQSQELEKNIKKMLDDERSSPQYREKEKINKELAELGSFVPTEVTAPMLGVLFSAIGATGMLLGGNSKSHAKFAMAAMNGMAEGFGKGREQYNKEQKAAFDTNVKLLQTKLSAIKDGLEDARREAILNKEAADIKVRQTLASNEAQFLQENTNKRGLESTIALVDGQLKNLNRAIQFQTSKATQLAGQLDAKETQLAMRKIESARREAEAIRSREFRAQQAESDRALRAQIAQGQLQNAAQNRTTQLQIAQLKLNEAGTRKDAKALQDIGPALRNIAVNYPDGTANNLIGASTDDKKKIQGAFRALQESEETADFIARNPKAVGALAKLRNIIKIDAIKSLKSEDETQTVAGKSAIVESQIDAAVQKGIVTKDEAEAAKILEKRLFGLALADVQGSGQRGSVYLDRQFQNLYDQASRPDTLLKVIKERSGENNRNLKVYRLGVERHDNPELFPLTLSETQKDFNNYLQERSPSPSQDHIEKLRSDPSPKMKKFFDEAYGEGAANRILGSK
jgi:hypothetical protein